VFIFPLRVCRRFFTGKKRIYENDSLSHANLPTRVAQPFQNDAFVFRRLATYRYYNMDQVIGQALACFRRIAEREGRTTVAAQAAARAIAAN
jgi:hypothetical protein